MAATAFDFSALLAAGLQQMGVPANARQTEQLLIYLQLLDKSRGKINLVAVDAPPRLVSHHLLDSLSLLPHLRGEKVLDFGTGAGLPGLPLACVDARRHYTLLDSRARRIAFLRYVCQTAAINRVELLAMRVQALLADKLPCEVGRSDNGRSDNDGGDNDGSDNFVAQPAAIFDTIVTRAVASLQDVLDLTRHLQHPGCRLIAMKGQNPTAELKNIHSALPYSVTIERVELPNIDAQRHLAIIDFK